MFQNLKNFFHVLQAVTANIYYGFPSKKLKVIGVTGTDGKTTTTHLIYHILKLGGKKVSMVSSIYAKVGSKEFDTGFHVTTPDVFPLQKLLADSVKNGDEYFVLETTSHALYQNRVFGIRYEIGVLTNVTHEHLDMHHTLEEYTHIKLQLLRHARYAVANEDDQSFKMIKNEKLKVIRYNSNFNLLGKLPPLPKFNQYNYSAAYTISKVIGISDDTILRAMKTFKLPKGRYDIVATKPFTAIIDFAHTPNGIYQILQDVKKRYVTKRSRLIHVFGSAGRRDQTKRPAMGEASGTFANYVILTEEDYRDEDPVKICNEIAIGLKKKGTPYEIIINRKKAIEKAFEIAKKGDVVIATGKGHETSLCRGSKEYPWDERKTFKNILSKL